MFVSACDRSYILYTKIWIRSLIRRGKIPQSKIAIMVFGADHTDSMILEKDLRREFKQINILRVCSRSQEFKFLEYKNNLNNLWFSDYLRAWVGKEIQSYIWMDSDILVMKNLRPLLGTLTSASTLSMAKEGKFYRNNKEYSNADRGSYFDFYLKCFNDTPSVHVDGSGDPLVMNCGVIVVDKNYEREWRDLYKNIWSKNRASKILKMGDLGQAIWNLILWKNGGKKLQSRYNSFSNNDHRNASVVHYARSSKSEMIKAALKLGLV